MAVIDHALDSGGPYPAQNEEFVLMHGDSLEMNGFISHLKLPHYVTFQSKLDSVRKTRGATPGLRPPPSEEGGNIEVQYDE
jgi:alpha-D-ribose 1-methylphosphonate 5-triphosphate synthase subunit PhnI